MQATQTTSSIRHGGEEAAKLGVRFLDLGTPGARYGGGGRNRNTVSKDIFESVAVKSNTTSGILQCWTPMKRRWSSGIKIRNDRKRWRKVLLCKRAPFQLAQVARNYTSVIHALGFK